MDEEKLYSLMGVPSSEEAELFDGYHGGMFNRSPDNVIRGYEHGSLSELTERVRLKVEAQNRRD